MKRGLIILFLAMAIIQPGVMAQRSTNQKKITELKTEARKAFDQKNYKEAIRLFTKDLNGPMETDALKGLSHSHYHLEEYNDAVQYFKQLDDKDKLEKNDFLMYARTLIYMRNFRQLYGISDKYAASNADWFEEIEFKSLNKFRELRQPHVTAKNSRIRVTPFHEINSYKSDYAPTLHNGLMYIVSDRPQTGKARSGENTKYKLLSAKANGENLKEDLTWVTNKLHSGPISFSEKYIFYSATNKPKNVPDKESNTEDEISLYPAIYYKKLGEKSFEEKPLIPNSFVKFAMLDPYWDESSQALYYASDMPNGYGGLDLYYQKLNSDETWSEPVNLGPEINTSGNERSPHISDDVIYFASDGHIGYGRLDIFKASKIDNDYTIPENLGEGINSNQDDFSFIIDSSNATLGFFATNRMGGRGSEDIYKVDFSASLSAKIVIQALDWETQKQVDLSNIKISDKNGARVNFERWKSENSYNLEVFQLGDIIIQLNANGYKPESDIDVSVKNFADSISLNFTMFPLERGRTLTLFQDGFDNESRLNIHAKEKLADFYSQVRNLSYLSFTVIAHTDARGSDEDTNLTISRNQAETVREFFGGLGLDVRFITILGRGDKNRINNCQAGCTEAEYVQNRRIEIRIDDFFLD